MPPSRVSILIAYAFHCAPSSTFTPLSRMAADDASATAFCAPFHWDKVEKPYGCTSSSGSATGASRLCVGCRHRQQDRLQAFLRSEMERGFGSLERAVDAFGALSTGEESFYFTWCNHHLLIDGLVRATLFRECWPPTRRFDRGKNSRSAGACLIATTSHGCGSKISPKQKHTAETLRSFSEPTPLLGTLPAGDFHGHEARYEDRR